MKVVDLRPRSVKLALSLWGASASAGEPIISTPHRFSPAGLYGRLLERFMVLRVGQRPEPPASRPFLLSVGNLALGGTGKTPVVGALALDLAKRGDPVIPVADIRNLIARTRGGLKLTLDTSEVKVVGEPETELPDN